MPKDWNVEREKFVQEFQRRYGLDADGKPGQKTYDVLDALAEGFQPQTDESPDEVHEADFRPVKAIRVKVGNYKQFDAQWKNIHLGDNIGLDTIGRSGCLTCCLSDILEGFVEEGKNRPPNLSNTIHDLGGYNNRSWLVWNAVDEVFENLTGISWNKCEEEPCSAEAVFDCLVNGVAPIVEVKTQRGSSHFVVARGVREDGTVEICDPGVGDHHAGSDTLLGEPKHYTPVSLRILRPA